MKPDRAWVLLPSGRRLNLLAPDPQAWTDRDLAIGLSRTYRWAGYSAWDLPLSVAQHSLTVLALRSRSARTPTDRGRGAARVAARRDRGPSRRLGPDHAAQAASRRGLPAGWSTLHQQRSTTATHCPPGMTPPIARTSRPTTSPRPAKRLHVRRLVARCDARTIWRSRIEPLEDDPLAPEPGFATLGAVAGHLCGRALPRGAANSVLTAERRRRRVPRLSELAAT